MTAFPTLKPVESATLREQVVHTVRRALMNGHLRPGQTVTVKAIAAMVGASVMPAREAMNQLIAEGALELRPNRSAIVPVLASQEFREVTELRCHVEGWAAFNAVDRLKSNQIAMLERHDADMRSAAVRADGDAYLNSNFEFHFAMYRLGASVFVMSIIEKLWIRVGPLIRSTFNDEGFVESGEQHARIIAAIKDGERDVLKTAIEADIANAARAILDGDAPLNQQRRLASTGQCLVEI